MKSQSRLGIPYEGAVLSMVNHDWIHMVAFNGSDLCLLWTKHGADCAYALRQVVRHFHIHTLSDLAEFDRSCHDTSTAGRSMNVGPKVKSFWTQCSRELAITGNLHKLCEMVQIALLTRVP
ncbi:hypothetical protein KBB96_09220 [Luteolibacter ambystomatis]|uniref:Uncharacterized protein n=1 Tax=Luteolibacter ambystomatis TaxID=2824561 RepID=A0A975J2Z7_9BACT|nr:hypothetical protein [Luteolibacter ambystomatis]QUE53058.1 hypothetical protein KBB96_09220 [Luteolibacter ambystomatis]